MSADRELDAFGQRKLRPGFGEVTVHHRRVPMHQSVREGAFVPGPPVRRRRREREEFDKMWVEDADLGNFTYDALDAKRKIAARRKSEATREHRYMQQSLAAQDWAEQQNAYTKYLRRPTATSRWDEWPDVVWVEGVEDLKTGRIKAFEEYDVPMRILDKDLPWGIQVHTDEHDPHRRVVVKLEPMDE